MSHLSRQKPHPYQQHLYTSNRRITRLLHYSNTTNSSPARPIFFAPRPPQNQESPIQPTPEPPVVIHEGKKARINCTVRGPPPRPSFTGHRKYSRERIREKQNLSMDDAVDVQEIVRKCQKRKMKFNSIHPSPLSIDSNSAIKVMETYPELSTSTISSCFTQKEAKPIDATQPTLTDDIGYMLSGCKTTTNKERKISAFKKALRCQKRTGLGFSFDFK